MPTDPKAQPMTDKIEVEQIDLRFAEDAIPEDVFASIPQYLNVRTYVARAFARHRQSSSAVGDAGLRADYGSANSWAFEDRIIAKGECIAFASEPWTNRILAALQSQPGAVTGEAREVDYTPDADGEWAVCYIHDWDEPQPNNGHISGQVHGIYPNSREANAARASKINPERYSVVRANRWRFIDGKDIMLPRAALSSGPQGEEG